MLFIFPFKSESFRKYKNDLILNASEANIPIHKPWFELTEEQQDLVWTGNHNFYGIDHLFEKLE